MNSSLSKRTEEGQFLNCEVGEMPRDEVAGLPEDSVRFLHEFDAMPVRIGDDGATTPL